MCTNSMQRRLRQYDHKWSVDKDFEGANRGLFKGIIPESFWRE